jgi:ribosomal protein S18 acetylase RimI-like enzyme
MSEPEPFPCELLPWDTEFFNCRIARVCGDTLRQEQVMQMDSWCRSNDVRGLYFLSRPDDPITIQTAELNGFGLVDIRVTFEHLLVKSRDAIPAALLAGTKLRSFQPDDLFGLQSMARTGHGDTRFFSDPHFPRQRVEDLYSTWITLETQGRASIVLVATSESNQPLGYVSCHLDIARQEGLIGLIGVSQEIRGKGIGKSLVMTALEWYRNQGAKRVTVVTQGKNRAAQRLYQQCGFLSYNLQLWYHKWYPMELAAIPD